MQPKLIKTTCAVFAAFLFSLVPAWVQAQGVDSLRVTVDGGATVRSQPDAMTDPFTKLKKGTWKAVLSSESVYHEVPIGDSTGWVRDSQVSATTTAERKRAREEVRRIAREQERRERARKRKREREEQRLEDLRSKGYTIELVHFGFDVNSAGGVEPVFRVRNISTDKTVKYIYFTARAYNSVGDPVAGEMSGSNKLSLQANGPLRPTENDYYAYEPVIYAHTTDCMEVRRVKVEHLDGSTFTYVRDLEDIAADDINLRGDCEL